MIDKSKRIIGYGGGGGKGGGGSSHTPVEAPDSLRSRAFARVIDLLCEGEIEGLVNGMKSIYLNETPLQNDDGTFNFTGVTVATRDGTQGQSYIPGFPGVESEESVFVEVTQASPVVRSISNVDVNNVRVTISVPQLTIQDSSNGDINGTTVDIAIDVQADGGGYVEMLTDTISGKTTTKYQRSYLIPLGGDAPWDVRVRRITDDSEEVVLNNKTYWDTYTEIIDAKLRYPNSAIVATVIDSQQFNQVPQRSYHVKMMRIQIPSNYDPETREYTGEWDGEFDIAYSNNPAWCFFDLLTNTRYGLGNFINDAQIDKWTLYTIGRYCDEMVDDGFGGTEPRFTCNLYIQTQEEAYKILQDMASIFRGLLYWSAGVLTAVQDSPQDAVKIFNVTNVKEGMFTYSGSSRKTRHTVAIVSYNDPNNFSKLVPTYVEDPEGIARYGIVETSIIAIGCNSQGQAHRVGKWLLYTERLETETVSFTCGIEAALVRPGQIIKVQDRDRSGDRLGGRVMASTATTITADDDVALAGGDTYTLYVMLEDGTMDTRTVSDITDRVITVTEDFTSEPANNAIWVLSSPNIEVQTFRVLAMVETGDGLYEITAVAHNEGKFDLIEQDIALVAPNISTLTNAPDTPTGLEITEYLYDSQNGVVVVVTASWNSVSRATAYEVWYKRDNGNYVILPRTTSTTIDIFDAQPGEYTFKVFALSIIEKRSIAATEVETIYGKLAPPGNVENFSLVSIDNGTAHLTWAQSVDLDVLIGGYVRIRHTPDIDVDATWTNAIDIGPALPGITTNVSLPHVPGTYLAKFVDSSGNVSVTASSVTTTIAQLLVMNVVETITEHPGFTGTKTNCAVQADLGGLVIDSELTIDEMGFVDDWDYVESNGGIAASATYTFPETTDLGDTYTCQLTAHILAEAYNAGDLIDSRLDSIDDWGSFDGDDIDDVNALLYVRTTEDDPGGTPTWSSWRPFFTGQYVARAFQFQLSLTSGDVTHNIVVKELSVTIDMPDRVESGNNITSGAGTYSVNYTNAFWESPAIAILTRNMATGDYFDITSADETGFDIAFKNSAGTLVSRSFDYIAKGFGYKH